MYNKINFASDGTKTLMPREPLVVDGGITDKTHLNNFKNDKEHKL